MIRGEPEAPGHVLHEARLAAAGRAFQQDRQLVFVGGLEHHQFITDRFIVGLFLDEIFFGFYGTDGHGGSLGFILAMFGVNLATEGTENTGRGHKTRSSLEPALTNPITAREEEP